ncbi:MAG: single-stranded-DNA-specific exonuclease RecJ [Vicingaceae bacterium]|nr:single-stranded-DNA-specific exonuclease RecJ [Vicingaceae bacterium]
MEKRWQIKEQSTEGEIQKLSSELNNLDATLTNILLQRKVDTYEKAKTFFRPSLDEIHDPFLMKDMNKAVERLEKAIQNKERILVYGDYDVDGTTSVALVYSYLNNFYPALAENNEYGLEYYIPDRYGEGYGVSYKGIDYAAEKEITLIIALDCGIKAVEKVAYASEKGVDFIICDHHRPGDEIPKAVAVLDPKRTDCNYPYDGLSGCGVGFKLMQAWTQQTNKAETKLFEYLDLLAISTCADIVPLTGENRVFVHYGLKKINENPRLSIEVMKTLSDIKTPTMTVMDVVFTFAPRINAAGRISSGKKAVEMLVAENETEIEEVGKKINTYNLERRGLDKEITVEALGIIEADEVSQNRKSTVLFGENWHKGVIGIVASRLIETHYKPTIILTESKGLATGSARTVEGFDVYNAIEACSDLIDQFGGHTAAAGMTMKIENVPAFIEKFDAVVCEQIDDELLIPQVEIDASLELNQIDEKFNRLLKQFAPLGPFNMRPVFMSENVFITNNSKKIGGDKTHLRLEVFQESNPSLKFNCIGFGMGSILDEIDEGMPIRIAYNIEENHWNGRTTLQLALKDIKL